MTTAEGIAVAAAVGAIGLFVMKHASGPPVPVPPVKSNVPNPPTYGGGGLFGGGISSGGGSTGGNVSIGDASGAIDTAGDIWDGVGDVFVGLFGA